MAKWSPEALFDLELRRAETDYPVCKSLIAFSSGACNA